MDVSSIVTGGSAATFIVALAYAGRLFLDWRREKRAAPRSEAAASVSDATAVNAVLVRTVETLQAETSRQARKIKHLEDEAAAKDKTIRELGDKLDSAQDQIHDIAAELATLKTRP